MGAKWAALSNTEPLPTYRGTSRLDYILCNPCAFRALSSFWVDPQGFTDHAVLHAEFCWDRVRSRVPRWNMPMDIAKLEPTQQLFKETQIQPVKKQEISRLLQEGATSDAFVLFSQAFEQKLDGAHVTFVGS